MYRADHEYIADQNHNDPEQIMSESPTFRGQQHLDQLNTKLNKKLVGNFDGKAQDFLVDIFRKFPDETMNTHDEQPLDPAE